VRDVRVIERRERPGFGLEAGRPVGIVRDAVEEELDRDLAIEPRVAGPVHFPHPAHAERGADLVYADAADGGGRQSRHLC
jgi:hypothetical protein